MYSNEKCWEEFTCLSGQSTALEGKVESLIFPGENDYLHPSRSAHLSSPALPTPGLHLDPRGPLEMLVLKVGCYFPPLS